MIYIKINYKNRELICDIWQPIQYPIINSIIHFYLCLRDPQKILERKILLACNFELLHRHNRSTPTLIVQCFIRIFFSLTLFSYCDTMSCFCICKILKKINAFGKNIILCISGDQSHMMEFLYYDHEFEFIAWSVAGKTIFHSISIPFTM